MQGRRVGYGETDTRGGFTLTELLVVIGIIVILVGLLIPAVGAARKTARKATTESTMTVVTTAIQSFRTDHKRLPGYVSPQAIGIRSRGAGTSRLTVMENAILELAGGVVDSNTAVNEDLGVIEVGLGGQDVRINTFEIGSPDGPGYLTGSGNLLKPTDERHQEFIDGTNELLMPDILDGWGLPIALWVKDEFAGSGATFSAMDSNTSTTPSLFYYQGNRGYYSPEQTANASLMNVRNNNIEAEIPLTMHALLGHPSFPVDPNAATLVPAQPRGDFLLHSGGSDNLFLEQKDPIYVRAEYVLDGNAPSSADSATMDNFDDIIKAAS